MNKYIECLAELGVGGAHPGGLQLTKKALQHLPIDETSKILDLGCGTGQTAAYIAEHYRCHVTGIDAHPVMVSKAHQRFKSLQLPVQCLQGYAEALPFANDSFDYVLSESVLVFTDLSASIPEIRRVLKPNGKLVAVEMALVEPIPHDEMEKVKRFYSFTDILTKEGWTERFSANGFKRIEFEQYDLPADSLSVDQTPEYQLSEDLDEQHFHTLNEHQQLSEKYADSLDFRMIKCS